MIVSSIDWVSEEGGEADLVLSEDGLRLKVTCYPCHYGVGDTVGGPAYALFVKGVMASREQETYVSANQSGGGFFVIAEVVGLREPTVRFGSMDIVLDAPVPGDLRVGAFVEFTCLALHV